MLLLCCPTLASSGVSDMRGRGPQIKVWGISLVLIMRIIAPQGLHCDPLIQGKNTSTQGECESASRGLHRASLFEHQPLFAKLGFYKCEAPMHSIRGATRYKFVAVPTQKNTLNPKTLYARYRDTRMTRIIPGLMCQCLSEGKGNLGCNQ